MIWKSFIEWKLGVVVVEYLLSHSGPLTGPHLHPSQPELVFQLPSFMQTPVQEAPFPGRQQAGTEVQVSEGEAEEGEGGALLPLGGPLPFLGLVR